LMIEADHGRGYLRLTPFGLNVMYLSIEENLVGMSQASLSYAGCAS
jgi:hypothetical protein